MADSQDAASLRLRGILLCLAAMFLFSPLLYVQLVWATLLGWQVFGQLPDPPAIVGMLIIGASGRSLAIGSRAWLRWRWR
jgi:drug/metabolite transporter (DMT)-like permease